MFLTNTVDLTFDGLDFSVNVPGNEAIDKLWELTQATFQKDGSLSLKDFSAFAELIAPFVAKKPDGWDSLPEVSKTRLLFEIAKYMTHEALYIPELKKKS